MADIYADGNIVLSVDNYRLEYEAGSMAGGGTVFFRLFDKHNIPIHVRHIDDICAQLKRMKHTIEAFEKEHEREK